MSDEQARNVMHQLAIQEALDAFMSFGGVSKDDVKFIYGAEALVSRTLLFPQATTLRQRVFARSFSSFVRYSLLDDPTEFLKVRFNVFEEKFDCEFPKSWTLRGVMAACRRTPTVRKALSKLSFVEPPINSAADIQLARPLQDLADIIAHEATSAFIDAFYPGVIDVEPLTREHVLAVMVGMQREMDRESSNRLKVKSDLLALTPERQRALAERRRFWYGQFGITPKTHPNKTFSLWDVSNVQLSDPRLLGVQFDTNP